jgi:four helix bundle protein
LQLQTPSPVTIPALYMGKTALRVIKQRRKESIMQPKNTSTLIPISIRHFDIYRVTLELITFCKSLIPRISRFNRRTGEQMKESLASILQNFSEGMRRTGKDRGHLLTIALGSCDEVRSILAFTVAFEVITQQELQHGDGLADRICAMGYRLRQKMS